MSVRERQLNTVTYSSGGTSLVDLPRDAVYHWLSLSAFGGTIASTQAAMTGTGGTLESNFPFSLIRSLRVIRNGSDVVFQGSGAQLAKESYYLNKAHPLARLYSVSAQVETLRTATVRGVTVPANSQGIGSNCGGFTIPTNAGGVGTASFDMQCDLYFQLGNTDAYYSTLVDARKLASFQLEIIWAQASDLIALAGSGESAYTAAATFQVLSIDQDNLAVDNEFGTFKRSTLNFNSFQYSSSNNQVLLNRGNFYKGVQVQTRAFKNGASSTVAAPENFIISTIDNRINSNFSLRKVDFRQLQAKNIGDAGGRQDAWHTAQGEPQGFAYLDYVSAADQAKEMIPSFVMDQFDFQVSIGASASQQNGAVAANTLPLIDLMLEEVIPAVNTGKNAPRGAMNGSINPTSAKPYAR